MIEKIEMIEMTKEKCCGNCNHFKNEDANEKGWCEHFERTFFSWELACRTHCLPNNGWTEITTDNADEIESSRVVVTDGKEYRMGNHWHASLSTLAKVGGYYYYVLPGLKN